jgi:hypothetical protein
MAKKLFIGGLAFSTSTERLREDLDDRQRRVKASTGGTRGNSGRDSRGFGGSSRGGRW